MTENKLSALSETIRQQGEERMRERLAEREKFIQAVHDLATTTYVPNHENYEVNLIWTAIANLARASLSLETKL